MHLPKVLSSNEFACITAYVEAYSLYRTLMFSHLSKSVKSLAFAFADQDNAAVPVLSGEVMPDQEILRL